MMNETCETIDLTAFDDDFMAAVVEDRTDDEVPDGTYQCSVETVEVTRAKISGNPLLKWQLRILGPKCAGRMLFRNSMMITADNIKYLKSDLHTVGLDIEKLSELPARLGELLDVKVQVSVKTRGDNRNVYINSRISERAFDDDPGPGDADALRAF